VKTAATPRVMSQGSVVPTEKELDVAIRGEGFFQVSLPDGRTAYTRDGSFERNGEGLLVNIDGYQIEPGITIPDGANSITISADGTVEAFLNTDTTPTQLGQIQLARFVNKAGLESIGDNLFVETGSSGPAQVGVANDAGMGNLMQGYLEMSNVNAVTEIADLIAAQRAYEMNARVISGADEMLQATSQLR
jgi:flagellar basal-body rod protein FlgG